MGYHPLLIQPRTGGVLGFSLSAQSDSTLALSHRTRTLRSDAKHRTDLGRQISSLPEASSSGGKHTKLPVYKRRPHPFLSRGLISVSD